MRRIDLKKANVARSNTIRDINRQIILNYIRERGPISRADIAHETALQRSTVSLIVEDLAAEGLVEEVGGKSSGGRPPLLLSLRTADAVAIGVDVGTARTLVATSDLAGRVLQWERFDTPRDSKDLIANIVTHARELNEKNGNTIEGIGISLPGLVDSGGTKLYVPQFKWRDIPLVEEVSAQIGLPVSLENDANAAALAELWFGRPEIREVRDFILVLVEEGVGTGIVFDGQVYRGEAGAAGEFGHMTIGSGAPVACASGSRECWEAFASERSALARYRNLMENRNGGTNPSFGDLMDLALHDNDAARIALTETAHYLGIGIANLIRGLAPEAVIVGGPIVRAWPVISEQIQNTVESSICRGLPSTRIIASTLGPEPTLMGALSLVLASKFASVSVT
ncbi:MAG TPA: ROK family protein [Pyrinomonadaceae bacterium]|nr:ROK family protein [Pyrinomonadaceae bacterium]